MLEPRYDPALAVAAQAALEWLDGLDRRPVRPEREGGLVGPSVAALDTYWGNLCRAYGTGTLACTAVLALDPEVPLANLAEARVGDADEWTGAVLDALTA